MTMRIDDLPRCPKCGAPMVYLVEKEKNGNGTTRITRYYRCPACGTKVIDEQLLIKPVNGSIHIIRLSISKKVIYGTTRRRTASRPARQARRPSQPRS